VLTCPVCGVDFYRKPAEVRPNACCSYSCNARLHPRLQPGPKGVRRSPATEFKSGPALTRLPVGSVTIRKRQRRNDVRAWVKVADPDAWRERARVVYEQHHGIPPAGFVIHHIDGDSLNDSPGNLQALSRGDHARLHKMTP
jgi:hypothetical protein